VVVSNLTLVECDRTIIRATVERHLAEAEAQDLHALLASTARRWSLMRLREAARHAGLAVAPA